MNNSNGDQRTKYTQYNKGITDSQNMVFTFNMRNSVVCVGVLERRRPRGCRTAVRSQSVAKAVAPRAAPSDCPPIAAHKVPPPVISSVNWATNRQMWGGAPGSTRVTVGHGAGLVVHRQWQTATEMLWTRIEVYAKHRKMMCNIFTIFPDEMWRDRAGAGAQ